MATHHHHMELERDAHTELGPTVKATCDCGWKGTPMAGPHRDTAARMQHDAHLTSTIPQPAGSPLPEPVQSPEAKEAQEELAAERRWRHGHNDNALAAQLAEVRHLHAKADLRTAAARGIYGALAIAAAVALRWAVR